MLRRWRHPLLACLALFSATACGQDSQFLSDYAGEAYLGSLRAVVYDGEGERIMSRRGEGSAQFEPSGDGTARLVVSGVISDSPGDASFVIDGAYDGNAWTAHAGDIRMTVDSNGEIGGGGTSGNNRYDFSGRALPGRMRLTVELRPLDAKSAQVASRFKFDYSLNRTAPAGARTRGDRAEASEGTCRSIRYEMRPVASIGDGTMSMLNVPVCLK